LEPAGKLAAPRIVNLVTDPHERENVAIPHLHSWTAFHFNRILTEFRASAGREPPIPAGAPLEFVPAAKRQWISAPGRSAQDAPEADVAGFGQRLWRHKRQVARGVVFRLSRARLRVRAG
jgi:hypothetical protein